MSKSIPLMLMWGLKRSGNHAISNWLRAQGNLLFFNDIVDIAPILSKRATMPGPREYTPWLHERTRLSQRLAWRARRTKILASIEDHELTLRPFVDMPTETKNIIVLRDPVNLFASRIRKAFTVDHAAYPKSNDDDMLRVVTLWKSYARECLGETNQLCNKVVIYFPRWFSDKTYRKSISRDLGLRFSDAGRDVVSGHGGGSSFDNTDYNGSAKNMKVMERFLQVDREERLLLDEVLDDRELREYELRIEDRFGAGFPLRSDVHVP